jgi:hypothetical protein
VDACSADDRFFGIALYVDGDGYAAVQTSGYVTVSYTGTAPDVGYGYLLAASDGKVKKDAGSENTFTDSLSASVNITRYTGGEYLIAEVDTTNTKVGFFI